MNAKKAKKIRRAVYGNNVTSVKGRKYFRNNKTGQIVADEQRRLCQTTKKVN